MSPSELTIRSGGLPPTDPGRALYLARDAAGANPTNGWRPSELAEFDCRREVSNLRPAVSC